MRKLLPLLAVVLPLVTAGRSALAQPGFDVVCGSVQYCLGHEECSNNLSDDQFYGSIIFYERFCI